MDNFTAKLVELIGNFEGLSLKTYKDVAGVWTIGYGHTKGVTQNTPVCTQEQATAWLLEDMADAIGEVNNRIKVPLNDNQRAALISITFNTGPAVLKGKLGQFVNTNNWAAAASMFDQWIWVTDPATGVKVKSRGLQNRRAIEKKLFTTPA